MNNIRNANANNQCHYPLLLSRAATNKIEQL